MANVMIVEDEAIVALDLSDRLERLGHRVVAVCANGEDSVRLARELIPDLILMDIVLGGTCDGIEAAQRVGSHRPTPVLYVTAHSDARTLERAEATRPVGYLLKPFSERDFALAVDMAMPGAHGRPASAAGAAALARARGLPAGARTGTPADRLPGDAPITRTWIATMEEALHLWSEECSAPVAFAPRADPGALLPRAEAARLHEFILQSVVLLSESTRIAVLTVGVERQEGELVARVSARQAIGDARAWPGDAEAQLRALVAALRARLWLHGYPQAPAVELRVPVGSG